MKSGGGRSVLITVGAVAVVVGAIWIGQGLNLIPGSFMTGDTKWFIVGLIVAIVGLVMIVLGVRRPKSSSSES